MPKMGQGFYNSWVQLSIIKLGGQLQNSGLRQSLSSGPTFHSAYQSDPEWGYLHLHRAE